MKKVLALIVALIVMLGTAALAEDLDLTTFTDAELDGLELAIAKEREARANEAAEASEGEAGEDEEAAQGEDEAEAAVEEAPVFQPIVHGGWSESIRVLQQKLKDLGYLNGKVDGIFGPKSEAALKALQLDMDIDVTGEVNDEAQLAALLAVEPGDGVNLAVGTSANWSDWITPAYDKKNSTSVVSWFELEDQQVGDQFALQFEIEFKDVSATPEEVENFRFWAQGEVDGAWDVINIWHPALARLTEAPKNGVYKFTRVAEITEENANAHRFDIGFRCDYWASGAFRVRKVKVERGVISTAWSEGPAAEAQAE